MRKDVLAILLIIFIVTLSCLPLFENIHNINVNWDWLQMFSYYGFARQSILEYHQFPLRTPYFGGGYPLVANPLDGSLNPFFIPVLIFGEVIGLKVNVFLLHLIGALGMYYLTRYILGYNYLGAFFSSIVFCLGGILHRLMVTGMTYPPAYYFLTPLLLALFIKAKENRRYLIYTVFILTIMLTQLSLRFMAILLFLFLFSFLEIIKYREKRFIFEITHIRNLFIILLFTILLGSVKIFPMLELLRQNPRYTDGYSSISTFFPGSLFPNISKAFLVHQKIFPSFSQHWNCFYLGYLPVIFSFTSFLIYWHKTKRYFILLIIFTLLSFGAHTRLDLFRLLWRFPIFNAIEAPTRYFVPLAIFVIALTSGQIFSICEKIKIKFIKLIIILVITFTTVDLFLTNSYNEKSFPVPIPEYTKQTSLFQVKNLRPGNKVSPLIPKKMFLTRSWEWTMPTQYELLLQNIGKINAYTNIHLGEYATPKYYIDWNGIESFEPENYIWRLNPDYKGEIYFLNNPNNKAEFQYFSPNKIVAKINLFEPDILIINQNYDKYWRSDLGKPISHNGLLAINLKEKGTYEVKFSYVPVSFYLGLIISLLTLFFIIYYLRRIRRC